VTLLVRHWGIQASVWPGRRNEAVIWEPGDLLPPKAMTPLRAMGTHSMTAISAPQQASPSITKGAHITVPAWALALMVLSLFAAYVMLQENGWIVSHWMTIHEFFHDGRHALGFPCH
jgi:hypothetical protein